MLEVIGIIALGVVAMVAAVVIVSVASWMGTLIWHMALDGHWRKLRAAARRWWRD